jgi:hypothetical protein
VQFVNEDRFAAELSELTLLQRGGLLNRGAGITTHDVEGLTTPSL